MRSVRLGPADAAAITAAKHANSASGTKKLQIGIARAIPAAMKAESGGPAWQAVPGGMAAHWVVASPAAAALRIGLSVAHLPPSAEIRYAGHVGGGTVYGPFGPATMPGGDAVHWSPVLEGDGALMEVFVAEGDDPRGADFAVAQLSHLFASPADPRAERLAKDGSQFCEVDLVCRSATDPALADTGRAVARMTFTDGVGTYLCTGTLLASEGVNPPPYFYSARHCIGTQPVADTLTTHWFYDRAGCGSGTTSASYVQLPGGATILHGDAVSDVLFMRLKTQPPAGAVYAGWSSSALPGGTPLTAVHHPAGDWKKVSLGTSGGFSAYGGGAGSTHIVALWNAVATGVTEGGSSGSGIFTAVGSPASFYALRGGLHGGPSSCTATGSALRDYYSRFDQAHAAISTYLTPSSCTFTLSSSSHSVGAGHSGGLFTVTTQAGCAWAASSSSNWIFPSADTGSSMTGVWNGLATYLVSYQVLENTGGARSGTITVGGRAVTVDQAAGGAPCTYALNGPWAGLPGDRDMLNSFSVTAGPGCAWTAQGQAGWLVTSSAGVGSGDVTYTALANMAGGTIGPQRIGTITVAGQTAYIYQSGRIVLPGLRGDVNRNAKSDLFWRESFPGQGLSWWTMSGPSATAASYFEVDAAWQVAAVGDLDGDGRADIVWRRGSDGATYLWTLEGLGLKGSFDLGILNPAAWSLAGAADLNGDGRDDIVWRGADGTVYAWLMNGGAIASQGVIANPGPAWAIAGLADMNGDGKADIVFRNAADGGVYIYFMNGLAIASGGYVGAVDPAAWALAGAADFSGDGKADLLWRHASGDTWVWLMNGAALQSAGGIGNPGAGWSVRAFGDVDGDGRADIVWRHADGTMYLWRMNGTAAIAFEPMANPGGSWEIVAP